MGFHKRLMELKSSHRFTMSRRHLAERWCISIETLKRREKAGILIPLKLGRGVRYRITDIERLEQQAEVRR